MSTLTDQQRKFYENTLQVTKQEIATSTARSRRSSPRSRSGWRSCRTPRRRRGRCTTPPACASRSRTTSSRGRGRPSRGRTPHGLVPKERKPKAVRRGRARARSPRGCGQVRGVQGGDLQPRARTQLHVCPKCGYHFRIDSQARIPAARRGGAARAVRRHLAPPTRSASSTPSATGTA